MNEDDLRQELHTIEKTINWMVVTNFFQQEQNCPCCLRPMKLSKHHHLVSKSYSCILFKETNPLR